MGDSDILLL